MNINTVHNCKASKIYLLGNISYIAVAGCTPQKTREENKKEGAGPCNQQGIQDEKGVKEIPRMMVQGAPG